MRTDTDCNLEVHLFIDTSVSSSDLPEYSAYCPTCLPDFGRRTCGRGDYLSHIWNNQGQSGGKCSGNIHENVTSSRLECTLI